MASGGGSAPTVNPYQAAQADWLFNRTNQSTPFGQTINTFPGQQAPIAPTVGFIPGGLSSTAQGMYSPQATPGKGGNPTTQPMPPGAQTNAAPSGKGGSPQTTRMQAASASGLGGLLGGVVDQSITPTSTSPGTIIDPTANKRTGGVFPTGIPNTPGTTTQIMDPQLLALESGKLTTQANTLADVMQRQQGMANGGQPNLVSRLNTQGLPSGQAGFSGLPSGQALDGNAMAATYKPFNQNIANTMFQMGAQPLQREFGRNLDTIEQSLANKGLALGGDAASRTIGDFGREQSQALSDLASRSVLAGGQESSRAIADLLGIQGQGFSQGEMQRGARVGEQQSVFGQNEALRNARIGEQQTNAQLASASRGQQFSELATLLGLNQGAGGGMQAGQQNPMDMMGAFGLNQQGQMANAANRTAQAGGTNSALASLAGMGMMAAKM